MRRTEIIDGIQQIISAIDDSNIMKALAHVRNTGRPAAADPAVSALLLASFKRYAIAAEQFNPAAIEMSSVLAIDIAMEPQLWAELLIEDEQGTNRGLISSLRFAREHLPRFAKLLQQHTAKNEVVGEPAKANADGTSVLTVLVFEPDNSLSSPIRLANVLESVNHFYTACALMGKDSPSTLSVANCDSGSDKSFDFLGLATVMESVERLITTIWDRVFFYREHQFEERLDLISQSLPIIKQIKQMEEHKELEPELAEILRRNVFDGTNKFVQSGAIIPQIENRSEYDARKLLSPIQKLLVSAPAEGLEDGSSKLNGQHVDPHNPSTIRMEGLSDEDQDSLRELLKKMRTKDADGGTPEKGDDG